MPDDALCHANWNGEADAGVLTAGGNDGSVNADDFTAEVDEWAAGVAGIDGSVGLEKIFVLVAIIVDAGAAFGADDAGSDGLLKIEWRTDSEHPFSDAKDVRITECGGCQIGGELAFNFQNGKVTAGIGANNGGVEGRTIHKFDFNFVGSVHDMKVGQDVAIFIKHDAGTHAGLFELAFAGHRVALPRQAFVLVKKELKWEAIAEWCAKLR